jgi:hypothetical protein
MSVWVWRRYKPEQHIMACSPTAPYRADRNRYGLVLSGAANQTVRAREALWSFHFHFPSCHLRETLRLTRATLRAYHSAHVQ